MQVKSNRENDPGRCRELRQINRDINREIRKLSEDRHDGIRQRQVQKNEYAQLRCLDARQSKTCRNISRQILINNPTYSDRPALPLPAAVPS